MEVNHRFSISSYLGQSKPEKQTGVNITKFNQLVSKSQQSLQERLNNKDLQEVFKNKSVSMLFLDKIGKLLGKHHPDSLEARKFMGGPSSFPSVEMIRHLTHLLSNPSLSENTVRSLEKWIASEQACLPISLIFDAWGAVSEESVMRSTTKGDFPDDVPITHKIEPPTDEVETFSNALANEIKGMQPGDKFKMPAGSVQHVTRLEFTKNPDGTFDIIHFNTGLGVIEINGKYSTACKYKSISAEKLEDPLFWKQFVEVKMQANMNLLNDLLKNLNFDRPPVDVDRWLKKPLQDSGSCSFHAAEAEFKHSFIRGFPSLGEGWAAYKHCTSLMAKEAVKYEASSLEPSIERMLIAKDKIRQRYIDWMTIVGNPGKLEAAKNAYLEAITSLGTYSKKENAALIKGLPPLMALSLLDRRLNECLDHASFEQLNQIRNTYGAAVTFEDFNHMGYKQLKWLESTREVLGDVVEFAGWKGDILLKVRDLSRILLPKTWDTDIQTKLNYAKLDQNALASLLTDYIFREDPAIQNQLFQTLIKENIIHEDFSYDPMIVLAHIEYCIKSDPKKALDLASKPINKAMKSIVHFRIFNQLLQNGHLDEALELAKNFDPDWAEKQTAFRSLAETYVANGQIDKAMSVAETTELSNIMDNLCKKGVIQNTLKFANLIQDDDAKRSALCKVSFELAKQGSQRAAMTALHPIPYSTLGYAINLIVSRLCNDLRIDDALLLVSHIPREFYQDKSHMSVEDAFQRIVINLVRANRRHNAQMLAMRIPDGPLKTSITDLADTYT